MIFPSCHFGGVSVISFLLDTYGGASAAYGLRRLRTDHAGAAIRVRESGGDTEADIGFNEDGTLDTTTLLSHCGSNNGFITTWYDQSGNSRNATQATAANQPKIVATGSVITENGLPSIERTGTSSALTMPSGVFANSTVHEVFATYKALASQTQCMMINNYSSGYIYIGQDGSAATSINSTWTASHLNVNGASQSPSTWDDVHTLMNTGSMRLFNFSGTTDASWAAASTGILGSATASTSFNPNCEFSEIIIWQSSQSANRSGIENNINTYYSIY